MAEPKPPAPGKGRPGKDPIGPPLEEAHVREVFRRLAARPTAEQQAFVTRINWNVIDATTELFLMGWLSRALSGPAREFALTTLDKLPHPKRARHVARFRAVLPDLEPSVAKRVQDAFGPVLGGLPKRRHVPGPAQTPAKTAELPPVVDPKEASEDELRRLKEFFDRFGGGAR